MGIYSSCGDMSQEKTSLATAELKIWSRCYGVTPKGIHITGRVTPQNVANFPLFKKAVSNIDFVSREIVHTKRHNPSPSHDASFKY